MVFRLQSTPLLPRKRKLQCRNGYFLEVRPDGTVRGTKNDNSIYSELKNWSLTLNFEFHFTKKGRESAVLPELPILVQLAFLERNSETLA